MNGTCFHLEGECYSTIHDNSGTIMCLRLSWDLVLQKWQISFSVLLSHIHHETTTPPPPPIITTNTSTAAVTPFCHHHPSRQS
ncbi:hypothetical protein L1987_32768 [Smallanthus sonchifolius]|uniref:Uncharacterized protein n=1 Tax=Smallanthus sonchifolius TaxID=185202 RepID=A0ACB9HPW1_9ASTR|nr:hypothetical protein L1987_32768 [Smallanthus sonchifolius]